MAEINTDDIIAESNALLDDSLNSQAESPSVEKVDHGLVGAARDDSLMESDSLNEDSLNGSLDSVGDTYHAASFISKTQKKLFPSDLPPPCTMDQDKVRPMIGPLWCPIVAVKGGDSFFPFQVLERVNECQKLLSTRNVGSTMLAHAKSLCESLEVFNDAVGHVVGHIKVRNSCLKVFP